MRTEQTRQWTDLEIEGRRRTVTMDAPWRRVKRFGDNTDADFATEELAKFRNGETESVLFLDYRPDSLEFRLLRVTSRAYRDTEVLA